jgi:hypothetical protein
LIGLSISFEVAGYFPKVGGEIEARLRPTFFGWGLGALVVGPGDVKTTPPPPCRKLLKILFFNIHQQLWRVATSVSSMPTTNTTTQ